MTASYLVWIVSPERCISRGLISKMLCEVCLISGFQLEMGSESKENHLSCHFVHPSSVVEKFQLQLYTAELWLRTASRLLCDFLNQKYEANLLIFQEFLDVNSFLLGGTINIEYMATTPSPYTHAKDVHVCACARYESKPTSIVPSYFSPRAIQVDIRVFLDVTQHS